MVNDMDWLDGSSLVPILIRSNSDACYDRVHHFFSNTTPRFRSSGPLPKTDIFGEK